MHRKMIESPIGGRLRTRMSRGVSAWSEKPSFVATFLAATRIVEAARQAAVGDHQAALGELVDAARHDGPNSVRASMTPSAVGSSASASASPLPE